MQTPLISRFGWYGRLSGQLFRGGSWGFTMNRARLESRARYSPSDSDHLIGFRLVRESDNEGEHDEKEV